MLLKGRMFSAVVVCLLCFAAVASAQPGHSLICPDTAENQLFCDDPLCQCFYTPNKAESCYDVMLLCATAPAHDWTLSGTVADVGEIPSSGGAWYITLKRPMPEFPEVDEYLQLICDHEQDITTVCAQLDLFDEVTAAGFVRTNEPNTGQRLTVRAIVVTGP